MRHVHSMMTIFLAAIALTSSVLGQERQKTESLQGEKQSGFNTEAEPDLEDAGFAVLFNGVNLDGWKTMQGTMIFEVKDGEIVGTVGKGASTFLCTEKIYQDFIFTCEMKWHQDGNTGVQVRSRIRHDPKRETVIGPQVEMEDLAKKDRGWSGGIYGQNCGSWFYPLKAPEHRKLKDAIDRDGWNRVTVKVTGNVFKTWINGMPAANWVDAENEFPNGFIGLQLHGGKTGIIHWRNLKILEL